MKFYNEKIIDIKKHPLDVVNWLNLESSLDENRMFRVWLKSINTEWNAQSENNSQ